MLERGTNISIEKLFIFEIRFCVLEEERKKDAKILQEATKHLYVQVIPNFADVFSATEKYKLEKDYNLTYALHRAGINCRHLGKVRRWLMVRAKLDSDDCMDPVKFKRRLTFHSKFLLTEIVARVMKNALRHLLREKMYELKIPQSEGYLQEVVDYFNLILGASNRGFSLFFFSSVL